LLSTNQNVKIAQTNYIILLSPYILVVPKATQRRIMEMRKKKKKIKRNMFKKPLLTFYTQSIFLKE